ncbi:MAG: YjbF family lipoprotein [Pseudomonadota bacterium]
MKTVLNSKIALLCCLLLVASCGNAPQQTTTISQIGQIIDQLGPSEPGPTTTQIRASLTPEVMAQFGNAALKVAAIEKPPLSSVLIGVGQNGDVETFTTPDGVSFSFRNGMLVATRGLGADLMTADTGASLRAIRAGQGAGVVRIHRYLDGEDQIIVRSFVCTIRRDQNTMLRESCQSPSFAFENTYQIGPQGGIVGSRQWVSPERGYLSVEDIRN